MKFSEQWLREWVNPAIDSEQLQAQLTMAGLEVDSVTPVAGAFQGVLVAQVLTVEPHPNAEKLRCCTVDVGQAEALSIVCGAANVRPGIKVPAAVIGAELPGLQIKKAKLRGIESFGMLCSAEELGLAESASGLLELPADAPVGQDFRDYYRLNDCSIEVDLTPNRGDCLSLRGLAREVAALNGLALTEPRITAVDPVVAEHLSVHIESPAACPRYLGRSIRKINPQAQSPLWLTELLRRSGIRPLHPVVDVTNYLLLELGQPMHAFDLSQIDGDIRVRQASAGETLTLLNGQQATLNPEFLVIADAKQALALAGIMGGQASAVTASTQDIFLEAAFFSPLSLAGKARKLGLHTDSSHRFERGVDPELAPLALERATELLLAIVGGEPGPIIEQGSARHLPVRSAIHLRHGRIGQILGIELASTEVEAILSRLGCRLQTEAAGWRVEVPSHRFDLALEVDLIEELARVYGYDRIPVQTPKIRMALPAQSETRISRQRVRTLLADRGYSEAITYSFVDAEVQQQLFPAAEVMALANPITSDLAVMRVSLWPGLIKAAQHNLNRQQSRVRLFELGQCFELQAGQLQQNFKLGGIWIGSREPEDWHGKAQPADFYDLKGDIEALLALTGTGYRLERAKHPLLHPGQSAEIWRDDQLLGVFGALHPQQAQKLGIGKVYLFELDLALVTLKQLPKFSALSSFPSVRRDLALVLDREIAVERILSCIRSAGSELLVDVKIFDVYQGQGVEESKKSVAVSLILQHSSHTLTEDEVLAVQSTVITALSQHLGAILRE